MPRNTVRDLSARQRVEKAKAKTQRIIDELRELISLHEANRIINYSPRLAEQIPRSYAAHAFRAFQYSMHRFELVRLCAVLDPCPVDDLEKVSLSAIANLIEDDSVLAILQEERRIEWANIGTVVYDSGEDPQLRSEIERIAKAHQEREAIERGAKYRHRLERGIKSCKCIVSSPRFKAVKNHRDKHLAHSLEQTRLETKELVPQAKFGDEQGLLYRAIAVAHDFHLGINGAGYSWRATFEIAQRYATALWQGCNFTVLE